MTIDEFWSEFLKDTGRSPDTKYTDAFCFDITEKAANGLLELVLQGKKQATSSSLKDYEIEGEELPKAGELSIVTDFAGNPRCVIETTAVSIIPYNEMTFDIVKREGEDECLETWQMNHEHFFRESAKQLGCEFTYDMPVVFEDFKLIYSK